MDKNTENVKEMDFIRIKTGINLYRCFTIICSALSMICAILYLIYTQNLFNIIFSFTICMSFILATIFMDKLVYILKLPTNYLFVYRDKIIYKKKKKQIVFEINKIKYEFHPFYEDFETSSQLIIIQDDRRYSFLITRKQFEAIDFFIKK